MICRRSHKYVVRRASRRHVTVSSIHVTSEHSNVFVVNCPTQCCVLCVWPTIRSWAIVERHSGMSDDANGSSNDASMATCSDPTVRSLRSTNVWELLPRERQRRHKIFGRECNATLRTNACVCAPNAKTFPLAKSAPSQSINGSNTTHLVALIRLGGSQTRKNSRD
jgi:hypothetical protein